MRKYYINTGVNVKNGIQCSSTCVCFQTLCVRNEYPVDDSTAIRVINYRRGRLTQGGRHVQATLIFSEIKHRSFVHFCDRA